MDSFIKYEEFPTLKEAQEKFTNSSEVKAKIFPSKNTSVATKFDQNKDKPLKVKSCEASTEGGKEVGGIKSKVDGGDGAPQERTKNAGNKTKSTGRGCDFGDRRCRQDPNRSIDSYNIKGSGKTVSSHDKMNFVHHQGVKGLYEESLGNVTNVNHGNKNRKQKASVLENDTFDLPPEVKSEYIHKLKERNSSWPLAKYFCGLCNYHMKNLSVVERHRKDERHMSLLEASDFLDTLVFIPKPTEAQSCVISTTLKNLQESIQMKTQNFSLRQSLVYNLERSLSQKYPDWKIELHLYGSSRTGFALIDSDVNIGFISNVSTSEMYAAFKDILGFLKTNPDYESVTLEWHNNTPVLYLEDAQSKLLCKVSAFSQEFIKTSLFLQACVEKEPRLLTVGLAFRYWARLCNLDDEKSGLLPPNAFILMCVYYFQAQRVLPFLQPQASKHTSSQPPAPESSTNKVSVTTVQEEHQKLTNLLAKWKTSNNESVGKLWLGLLRFYAIDFKYKKKIVSLRDKNLTRGDKGWSHSRFAIEDPYVIKKNVAGGISHSNVTLHIFLVLKHTYKYFATPQLEGGSLFKFLDIKRGPIPRGRVHNRSVGEEGEEDDDDDDDNGQEDIQDSLASNLNELNLDYSIGPETDPIKLSTLSKEARNRLAPDIAYKLCRQFVQTDLKYKFDVQEFTQGKDPPIMCAICQKKGHLKDECPDLILPPILPRQELSKKFKNLLSKVCSEVYREWNPTQHELNISQNFFKQIEKVVLKYNPSAVLEQFGSLMNGFGLKSSDVDICMTFKDNKSGEMIDQVKIIQELASHLQKSPYFSYVIPIMSAKVPIVKFSDLRGVLEGDISLYNTLALHNTRMLKLYSTIDERLRVLGFVIKIFAKVCQIGDASKGSLSSYAYILMLIYYLQQRNPPVLPVLQELYDKTLPKPERMVNGANIWYREDISDLGKIWPHYGKNTESIGQLWVGLLKFYSDEFNFDEHVVCIRQLNKMSKMEKLWCSKTFAIEDPFDLNHNLGSGLSRKMYVYIRRSFIRSFHHFSTSLDHLEGYRSAVEYFFDRNCLTYGPPPSDRVCRKCGTLGHLVKRCPFLEENKSRKKIDNLLEWPRKQDTSFTPVPNGPGNAYHHLQNLPPGLLPAFPRNHNHLLHRPHVQNPHQIGRSNPDNFSQSTPLFNILQSSQNSPQVTEKNLVSINGVSLKSSHSSQLQSSSEKNVALTGKMFADVEAELLRNSPSGLVPRSSDSTMVKKQCPPPVSPVLQGADIPQNNLPSYASVCQSPPRFHASANRQDSSAYSGAGLPLCKMYPHQYHHLPPQPPHQLARPTVTYPSYTLNSPNNGPGLLGYPPMYVLWPQQQQQLGHANSSYSGTKDFPSDRSSRDILLADLALPVADTTQNLSSQ